MFVFLSLFYEYSITRKKKKISVVCIVLLELYPPLLRLFMYSFCVHIFVALAIMGISALAIMGIIDTSMILRFVEGGVLP